MSTDTMYLRVDPAVKAWLREEAQRQGVTMQQLINDAITLLQQQKESSQPT